MGEAIGKTEDGSVTNDALPSISSCPFTTSPNLFSCHQCGVRLIARIQTFYSQWRIVLLCPKCFAGIRSAQMCSYCFSLFSESEYSFLDCSLCCRRVHRACVPLHHRNLSRSQLDAVKFFCIDCRPIPKLCQPKASGCSTSRSSFMVPLKDLVSGTKSSSEKKAALHAIPKENVTKEKMVGTGFGELNSRDLGAVNVEMEPSNVNLFVSDEKMAVLLHHQPMNESDKISGSLFPGKEQWSCDTVLRTDDSDSCTHDSKIEDSAGNESLLENRLYPESILTSCPLFNTACPGDLTPKEIETSIKFPDSIDGGSNDGSQMLSCHGLNTWLKNTKAGGCDGEGSPKLQRKSIGTVGLDGSMKKYFRKRWRSGRIKGNSQSILSNSPLCKWENLDLMKRTSVCSTNSQSMFSLQEKECSLRFPDYMHAGSKFSLQENRLYPESMLTSCPLFNTVCPGDLTPKEIETSIKFPDSIDGGSNAGFQILSCHSLNTWLKNTKAGDCDGEGSPKLQRKSIETVGLDGSMKKYFRKRWRSGRIKGNSQSISSNSPLCKWENLDLMKQTSVCSTNSPSKFSLQENECSLRFPDYMHAGRNVANGTMPLINCKFGDREGSSTIQESSIRARDSHRTSKKYFRKRWGSGGIMQGNSQSILSIGPLFKQNGECSTAYAGDFLKDKESPIKSPGSPDNGSNTGCALLPSYNLNDWSYSAVPITKYMCGIGDTGRSARMQRMSNAIGLMPLKKYFRKHRRCGRILQKEILNEI